MNERVCPRCGAAAGGSSYCTHCGLNLAEQYELPTREHWEAHHAESALGEGGAPQQSEEAPGPAQSHEGGEQLTGTPQGEPQAPGKEAGAPGGAHDAKTPGGLRGRWGSLGATAKRSIAGVGAAAAVAAVAVIVLLATGAIGGSNGQSGGFQTESGGAVQEEGGQSDAAYDEEVGYEEGGEYPEEFRSLYIEVCERLGRSTSTCQGALSQTEAHRTLGELETFIEEWANEALAEGQFPHTEEGETEAIGLAFDEVVLASVELFEEGGWASVASLKQDFRHMLLTSTLERDVGHKLLLSPNLKKAIRHAGLSKTG